MNKSSIPLSLLFSMFYACNAYAVDYFTMDFETGLKPVVWVNNATGTPVWVLPQSFDSNYGPGNLFEVTDTAAHSGNYSLRFTYEGRNNICNTCGSHTETHKTGLDGVDYFVADSGGNLTSTQIVNNSGDTVAKGPAAQPGRIVYNKDNGYSRWEITSVGNENATNDKLTLKLLNTGIDGSNPAFNGGDEALIARQCGVDGHVGGIKLIDKRSDCNAAISWFQNVEDQVLGTSIFRRQYLKAEVTGPGVQQKLHYFKPNKNGNPYKDVIIFAVSLKTSGLVPKITNFGSYGGDFSYSPAQGDAAAQGVIGTPGGLGFPDFEFERGVWYYIEEQYKAATKNPGFDQAIYDDPNHDPADPKIIEFNSDGQYTLWMSKSGEENTTGATPLINLTNIPLPPLHAGGLSASFWGNVQHNLHARGSWYIDDVYIAERATRIGNEKFGGGVTGGGNNTSTPVSPALTGN